MNFKSFIEDKILIYEENLIMEFATLSAKDHNFGVDVKLHVMQPGDKKLQHAPRVKIIKKGINGDFSISLDDFRVIGDYSNFVTNKELNILISNIKRYKKAFLNFWNDPDMSTSELIDIFRQIDSGFEIELTKNENHHFSY